MRRPIAQIVLFITACLLADGPHVRAQSEPCPPRLASAPDNKQPSDPTILIAKVTFSGLLQMPVSDQDQIAASIKQRTNQNSLDGLTDEAAERVRVAWQDRGYFKVQVTGEEKMLASSATSQRIALSFRVEEGLQYSLSAITFKNNKVISDAAALRGLFPIDDGDIFSREKIEEGLQNLRKAYQARGYINFVPVPDTKFDDDTKLISLDVDLDEGKQFYISSVHILGLDDPARQELLKDLSIKRGQIYTGKFWELFLLKYGSMLPDCGCKEELGMDERAGTVAVTLDFWPCSTH
jgi:outer membrane protein assembly factor BamA